MRTLVIILGLALAGLAPSNGWAQVAALKPAPHLGGAEKSTLQQSWICAGRLLELRLELSGGGAFPRVTAYTVDGLASPPQKLEQWNQRLKPMAEFVRASVLCTKELEAVLVEGTTVALDGKRERITITASGGGGKIGGFTSNPFWAYTGN